MVEFYFSYSKLRKQPFSAKKVIGKCKISNLEWALHPLPSPMIYSILSNKSS